MKKTLISIAATLAVIVAVLCMGLAMTACNKATSYTIKVVYADGTPVNGLLDGEAGVGENGEDGTQVMVQVCAVNPDTHVTGFCNAMMALDENGTLQFKNSDLNEDQRKSDEKWHVEIQGLKDGYTYEAFYLDGYGTYTITVTQQN